MLLLDSNIIIYLRDPAAGPSILEKLGKSRLGTCNVIIAEVLGFSDLTAEDSEYFGTFFASMKNYPFDALVTQRVIEMRRALTIQLPDAIIATSAIEHHLTLWTHNTEDFKKIPGLLVFDPLV